MYEICWMTAGKRGWNRFKDISIYICAKCSYLLEEIHNVFADIWFRQVTKHPLIQGHWISTIYQWSQHVRGPGLGGILGRKKKTVGVCHKPWKLGPKNIEAKMEFGTKIKFWKDWYQKRSFCCWGMRKSIPKVPLRSLKKWVKHMYHHICITQHRGSTLPEVRGNSGWQCSWWLHWAWPFDLKLSWLQATY